MLARTRMACPSTRRGASSAPSTRSAARSCLHRRRRVLEQHRELVAAQARGEIVLAQRRAQALGDGHEQRVARRVPERVVDGLEVVEVEEHDGGRVVVAARAPPPRRSEKSERLARPVSGSCRASCARRSLSSVSAASARAVWPLSSALPACLPTVSSSRRSRRLNDSLRSTASSPTMRVSPRNATTIAAGRPRPVRPVRRSGRRVREVDHGREGELLEERALRRRRVARERAAGALPAVDLRAQHAALGRVQHERGAGGADQRARVLEQHAGGGLRAGGGVHVAHDREQRLDLRALAPLPQVRAVGEHQRAAGHGQEVRPKSASAGKSSASHRARLGLENAHAERGRREDESACREPGGEGTAAQAATASLTDHSGRFRWG